MSATAVTGENTVPHLFAREVTAPQLQEAVVKVPEDFPEGKAGGQRTLMHQLPDGRILQIPVPDECPPGGSVVVNYPVMNLETEYEITPEQINSLGLRPGDQIFATLGDSGIVAQTLVPEEYQEGFRITSPKQLNRVKSHQELKEKAVEGTWEDKARYAASTVKAKAIGLKNMEPKQRNEAIVSMAKDGVKKTGKAVYKFTKKHGLDKKAVDAFNSLSPQQKAAVASGAVYFFGAPVVVAGAVVYGMSLS
eukprot:maker-scaffold_11-snap-gene-5.12-mRNA-1 protein AED:0.03 eAED:0.03 QI:198/1/1/1/1/1/5/47/249